MNYNDEVVLARVSNVENDEDPDAISMSEIEIDS